MRDLDYRIETAYIEKRSSNWQEETGSSGDSETRRCCYISSSQADPFNELAKCKGRRRGNSAGGKCGAGLDSSKEKLTMCFIYLKSNMSFMFRYRFISAHSVKV